MTTTLLSSDSKSLIKQKLFTPANKVLLIIHDVYQKDNYFPLGPAYLASMLQYYGAEVETYCMDLYHYTNEELAIKLQDSNYDLIGVGFMVARFRETIIDLCEVIDENKKDAWLVVGGHGPSPIPEYVLKESKVDIVSMGESELTIVDLLQCKLEKGDLSKVEGIAFRDGDEIVVNPRRNAIRHLDILPFPAWDVFPIEDYANSVKLETCGQEPGDKSLVFTSVKGCIAQCSFCYRLDKGIRVRSIPNVIEEIKILYHKYGIRVFYIMDELFVFQKKRILEFEKALRDNNLDIRYGCDARVDILDIETLNSLKRSGCRFLCIGFESADNEVLRLMDKRSTVEKNIWALENIREVGGLGTALNFIWNNPGDDEKTLRKALDLTHKYNDYDQLRTIRPVTAYPGSPLYYDAIQKGLLKGPEDFFDRFSNSDLITVNHTELPTSECYDLLFEANKELINKHYQHTNGNMLEAERLIQQYKDLYNGNADNFRGVRHYDSFNDKKFKKEKGNSGSSN